VLFICTGNVLDTIPGPLLDRMEVIHLSGYIAEEKREIAKQYLLPQALEQNGLKAEQLSISESAIDALNRSYCRESGVRNLKNQIDKICRKAALQTVEEGTTEKVIVNEQNLTQFLGPPLFTGEKLFTQPQLPSGVATGVAWTSLGKEGYGCRHVIHVL
jgi:Lon-like ATP-dependent protease